MQSRLVLPQASINFIDSIANNVRSFFYFFAITVVIIVTEKVDIEWKWAHLFFDYEYGFLKRGLVGELIGWTPVEPSLDNFKVMSVLLLIGVAVVFYRLIKDMPNRDFYAFSFLFLFSPLLFRNYVHDWGRYDQLAILFVLLLIYHIEDETKSKLLLYSSPLLLFVHEGFVLWAFPTILTIAFFEQRSVLYKLLPILLICGICILIWGGLDTDPRKYYFELREWAAPHSIHWPIVLSVSSGFSDVISDYAPYFWQNFNSTKGYQAMFFFAISALPLALITDKRLLLLSLASLVSTSLLFVLAADHWRWVSLLGTSAMFSMLYAHKKLLLKNPPALSYYLILLGLAGLLIGPIGIFPQIFLELNLQKEFFR